MWYHVFLYISCYIAKIWITFRTGWLWWCWLWHGRCIVAMVVQVVVILLDVAVVVAVAKHGGHDGVGTNPEPAALRTLQVGILSAAGLCTR